MSEHSAKQPATTLASPAQEPTTTSASPAQELNPATDVPAQEPQRAPEHSIQEPGLPLEYPCAMILRKKTETLASHMLVKYRFFSRAKFVKVEPLSCEEFQTLHESYRVFKNQADFYLLTEVDPKEATPLTGNMPWAVMSHNICDASVFWTIDKFKELLEAVPEVDTVQWVRGSVAPRLVVIQSRLNKVLRFSGHDFIQIKLDDGQCFIANFSGWQHGFQDCFYTLEEYEEKCLVKPGRGHVVKVDIDREKGYCEPHYGALKDRIDRMTEAELQAERDRVDLGARRFVD